MKSDFPTCRFCGGVHLRSFVDLGIMPLANSYVRPEARDQPEARYPLHARVCEACLLVQVEEAVLPEAIFSDYAYFSSISAGWVAQAKRFAEAQIRTLGLGPASRVVEIASNDGYLLQHFVAQGVPVLGVEPAANIAKVANEKGIATDVSFFGRDTARRLVAAGHQADLVVANNVLAHVPDLDDFVGGLALVLKPGGRLSLEFPHLLNLMAGRQFDTIYHEHLCYFSAGFIVRLLAAHDLSIAEVECLATHGGSLRITACHKGWAPAQTPASLADILAGEHAAGLDRIEGYGGFAARVAETCTALRQWLAEARAMGRTVAAYGAAAKGNTLLNACGMTSTDIICVADMSPHKQGLLLPGSHIPIVSPEALIASAPDDVLILPWNLSAEIAGILAPLRKAGTRLVIPVPMPHALGPQRIGEGGA